MGGFYGSVQVRTDDRGRVVDAADAVATARGIRCLVGPPRRGWVGVYAENGGQDEGVGQALAEALGGTVLQLVVHDDDVLAWWHWLDGALVDRYWSRPGYFSERERAQEERLTGDPTRFDWLDGAGQAEVSRLMARNAPPVFESERLAALGRLLGIDNLVTSYEYLQQGERDGIVGWRQFREVPQGAAKRAREAQRAAREAAKAARRSLVDQGVLLYETSDAHALCGAAVGDGYLLCRAVEGRVAVEIHRPPFHAPERLEEALPTIPIAASADARGERVALACGQRLIVWDAPSRRVALDLPMEEGAHGVAIHPAGQRVVVCSSRGLIPVDLSTGARGEPVALQGARQLAWHPSGEWWVAGGPALVVASLEGESRVRYPGGRNELSAQMSQAVAQQMAALDPEAIRRQTEQALARMQASLPPATMEKMRAQMERTLEQVVEQARRMQAEGPPATARESIICVGFSRDGRWMWAGTQVGLRVWDADEVRRGRNDMPAPRHRVESFGEAAWAAVYVYVVTEAPCGRLLFADAAGRLRALDLASGEVRLLVEHPEGLALLGLWCAGDSCATVARRLGVEKRGDAGWRWEIWAR